MAESTPPGVCQLLVMFVSTFLVAGIFYLCLGWLGVGDAVLQCPSPQRSRYGCVIHVVVSVPVPQLTRGWPEIEAKERRGRGQGLRVAVTGGWSAHQV